MKGKLTNKGWLMLERKGRLQEVSCPYNDGVCGDWCALFSEPKKHHLSLEYHLDICRRTFRFTEFTDLRGFEK